MKKFTYVLAALATEAIAAPTIVSAEDFTIRAGGEHRDRDRGEFRDHDRGEIRGVRAELRGDRDRGWHRHDRGDKVVIIKHHRHHDDD